MYIIHKFTDKCYHLLRFVHQVNKNVMMYFVLAPPKSMIALLDRLC